MTLNQRLTLLLLLGLTVTSAATSCIFSEDGAGRCVCNSMGILNPENLMCLQASELELRDGTLDVSEMAVSGLTLGFQMIQINKLIFNNVTISFSFISVVISFLPRNLNEIHIISSTLEVVQHLQPPLLQEASRIKTLYLEDTTVDPSLLQPSFQALHRWLFGPLKSLGLVRSGLVETDCIWAQRVENLTHLDLSENPISYTSLQNISHCASLSFKYLKSLHLRHSNLTSLQSLCTLLSLTPTLTQLDVSRNNFSILHYPQCFQVKPLTMLNLSHSGITEVFHDPPQTLKKLFLSNNRLIRLPSLDNLSHLQVLKVDNNRLTVLITETDVSLSTLEQLDTLHAGRNPYQCDCALEETITFLDSADMKVDSGSLIFQQGVIKSG
uniref:Monocyte differentiation antigen CD14 n=1 Tax=Dicentrarchus labrax TaxID=13489 RepID=A0A8C4E9V0_DICLA